MRSAGGSLRPAGRQGPWGTTAALASVLVAFAIGAGAARADTGDIGVRGQAYTGTTNPNGTKRSESTLWFHDGRWWGNVWDSVSKDFHIFWLNTVTQAWIDTGVTVDTRSGTHADTLVDGNRVYVVSHVHSNAPASGYPTNLYRFTYNPASRTYSRDSGFPVRVNNYKTKSVVLEKDSAGTLWATWMQDSRVYVNRSVGDDLTWGTPFVLPVTGVNVTSDEISSVIAFGGDQIGVMWSNQAATATGYYFAVHHDGMPDTSWDRTEVARAGAESADDHINLKADAAGRVYAAVKTSMDRESDPLTELLVRDPATGAWARHTVGRKSECPNRPVVLVDDEHKTIRVLQTGPSPPAFGCTTGGGTIYEKTSAMDSIAFATGYGTPVIRDADSAAMHDVSSTKQSLSSSTGVAALAVNTATSFYWHHFAPLGPPPPPTTPTAAFTAAPTTGPAPLAVSFRDESTGGPTSWSWDFGDGTSSTAPSPSHTYTASGTYNVTLTVANAAGSDTETRAGYITVEDGRTFTATADAYVKESAPNENNGGAANLRVRNTTSGRYRTYLRFNVADLPAPAQAAKLRLYVTDASPDGGSVFPVADTTWKQSTITWSNAPPFGPTPMAAAGAVALGNWVELDVTGYVTGNGTYSFALVNQSTDLAMYSSREGPNPPQLVVRTG